MMFVAGATRFHEPKPRIAKTQPLVPDIQNFAQDVFDTVREPLLVLDAALRVRLANSAFYQTFHVSSEETENRLIYQLGNGQWDIPALRTLLEDIVPGSSVFNDFVLEHDFPDIGRRVMLLNARKLHAELVLLAMEDVTDRRRSQQLLEQIERYAQDVVDTVREPLLILDSSLRVHSANRAFYQTFHVSPIFPWSWEVNEPAVVSAPKRILVADDEPSILRLVTAVLRRADYAVDTATCGRDALEKIELSDYDVVMLDLMMPEVNGFDVLARLRSRDPQRKFVVIMSAASNEMVARATGRNVFAALRKPFAIDDMIATVRACIAAPAC